MDFVLDLLKSLTILDVIIITGSSYLLSRFSKSVRTYFKIRKAMAQRWEELEAKKCKTHHAWISIDLKGKEVNVCKECNWCPSYGDYIKEMYVKAHLKAEEFQRELKKYKKKRMQEISTEFNIESSVLDEISKKILVINKEFTVDWLTKQLDKKEE